MGAARYDAAAVLGHVGSEVVRQVGGNAESRPLEPGKAGAAGSATLAVAVGGTRGRRAGSASRPPLVELRVQPVAGEDGPSAHRPRQAQGRTYAGGHGTGDGWQAGQRQTRFKATDVGTIDTGASSDVSLRRSNAEGRPHSSRRSPSAAIWGDGARAAPVPAAMPLVPAPGSAVVDDAWEALQCAADSFLATTGLSAPGRRVTVLRLPLRPQPQHAGATTASSTAACTPGPRAAPGPPSLAAARQERPDPEAGAVAPGPESCNDGSSSDTADPGPRGGHRSLLPEGEAEPEFNEGAASSQATEWERKTPENGSGPPRTAESTPRSGVLWRAHKVASGPWDLRRRILLRQRPESATQAVRGKAGAAGHAGAAASGPVTAGSGAEGSDTGNEPSRDGSGEERAIQYGTVSGTASGSTARWEVHGTLASDASVSTHFSSVYNLPDTLATLLARGRNVATLARSETSSAWDGEVEREGGSGFDIGFMDSSVSQTELSTATGALANVVVHPGAGDGEAAPVLASETEEEQHTGGARSPSSTPRSAVNGRVELSARSESGRSTLSYAGV